MLKSLIGAIAAKIKSRPTSLYTCYSFTDKDGNFDYSAYKKIQVETNKRKIGSVWVKEENIKFLSDFLRHEVNPKSGICHGTRRGLEQKWFNQYLGLDNVFGTEISDTAKDFANTIEWDFHNVKDEWRGAFDFIYSNSLDHSYDPSSCLQAWMSCLSKKGVCILEHTTGHFNSKPSDPFGAPTYVMPYLVLLWSEGKFYVEHILNAPADSGLCEEQHRTVFFVLRNTQPAQIQNK